MEREKKALMVLVEGQVEGRLGVRSTVVQAAVETLVAMNLADDEVIAVLTEMHRYLATRAGQRIGVVTQVTDVVGTMAQTKFLLQASRNPGLMSEVLVGLAEWANPELLVDLVKVLRDPAAWVKAHGPTA